MDTDSIEDDSERVLYEEADRLFMEYDTPSDGDKRKEDIARVVHHIVKHSRRDYDDIEQLQLYNRVKGLSTEAFDHTVRLISQIHNLTVINGRLRLELQVLKSQPCKLQMLPSPAITGL